MTRMSASERYAARQERKALGVRERTLSAAMRGAHHARLRARYGPDWRRTVEYNFLRRADEWDQIVERNWHPDSTLNRRSHP